MSVFNNESTAGRPVAGGGGGPSISSNSRLAPAELELRPVSSSLTTISVGSIRELKPKRERDWREAFSPPADEDLIESASTSCSASRCQGRAADTPSRCCLSCLLSSRTTPSGHLSLCFVRPSACFLRTPPLALALLIGRGPPLLRRLSAHGCALAREILIHGRIYISAYRLYFKSNILGYKTLLDFPLSSVIAIGPRMTALVIPNSLELIVQGGEVVRAHPYFCLLA